MVTTSASAHQRLGPCLHDDVCAFANTSPICFHPEHQDCFLVSIYDRYPQILVISRKKAMSRRAIEDAIGKSLSSIKRKREPDHQATEKRPAQKQSAAENRAERVNALSHDAFEADYKLTNLTAWTGSGNLPKWDGPCAINLKPSSKLSDEELNACFDLVEQTSAEAYRNSSRGWKPQAKKEEMNDPNMKYLIFRGTRREEFKYQQCHEHDALAKRSAPTAFLSFMITVEDEYFVLYIYEIHLSPKCARKGIGSHLMKLVETIAHRIGVSKVMLTVFTSNTSAEAFYRSLGYDEDEFSPPPRKFRGGKTKRPDYIIMSKPAEHLNKQVERS